MGRDMRFTQDDRVYPGFTPSDLRDAIGGGVTMQSIYDWLTCGCFMIGFAVCAGLLGAFLVFVLLTVTP